MALLGADNLVPTTDSVPTTPIGHGKPLSIRILSMYAGRDEHDSLLLSSAVKSSSTFDAAPRAMNYLFEQVPTEGPLKPSATQDGSKIVYYSPAVLDTSLDIELRYSFDDFDLDQAKRWLSLAKGAADLPVFAVSTALGGPGGAAAGKSILYFAEKAVTLVLGAIDRWVDSENDWAATWTLSLDHGLSGIPEAEPGYVLFYGDGEKAEVLAPVGGNLNDQQFVPRSDAYRVSQAGTVVYAESPHEVMLDEPYILTYVNGAEEESLAQWKVAAVSAALTEKFLNPGGSTVEDLGELLEGYNDMVMARGYAETSDKLKSKNLTAKERTDLVAKRDAYLKNIQSDDVREIVSPEED